MSNRVIIFDTTLRDGEQSPGASMNEREKMEVAHTLAELGVDIIEAGFPISSVGDFEAVSRVAQEIKGPVIAGLARTMDKDIDRCWEAVRHADKPRIHTFIGTSTVHREKKLRKSPDEVVAIAVKAVARAKSYCRDVEFSTEDAARTELEFMARIVQAVIAAGATTVNIPDTVGYSNPWEFGNLIAYLFEHVSNIGEAVISVHCHNDLGLSVANSLAAVRAGARQVECTINGIGERAGNASLEEVVMNLKTRKDFFGFETGIHTERLYKASRLVSNLTGIVVQPNKAIVGGNAFAHEAGIHQDGVLKDALTYEIMRPADVGWRGTSLVLGKHSGRHAFRDRLVSLGHALSEEALEQAFDRFKELADLKKDVFDEDLEAIVAEVLESGPVGALDRWSIDHIQVMSGQSMIPATTIRLQRGGETRTGSATGDGPVDAIYKAIRQITGSPDRLVEYRINAVTAGTDALGEVALTIEDGPLRAHGRAAHTDIIMASANAYIQALNHLERKRVKSGEEPAEGENPTPGIP